VRGHHLLELRQRPHRNLFDSGDAAAGGRAQPHRDRDRLLVVEQQRRHLRAWPEPVAAGQTRIGIDRIAEHAQLGDVAADGPLRHAELGGQLGTGPATTAL
jgi:hypothetical protein